MNKCIIILVVALIATAYATEKKKPEAGDDKKNEQSTRLFGGHQASNLAGALGSALGGIIGTSGHHGSRFPSQGVHGGFGSSGIHGAHSGIGSSGIHGAHSGIGSSGIHGAHSGFGSSGIHGAHTGLGSSGVHGGGQSSNCLYWEVDDHGKAYCAQFAGDKPSVILDRPKPGFCPKKRSVCSSLKFGPKTCADDGGCPGLEKCCPDSCLNRVVCKPAIGTPQHVAPVIVPGPHGSSAVVPGVIPQKPLGFPGSGGFNQGVGGFNQGVGGFNQGVGGFNQGVGGGFNRPGGSFGNRPGGSFGNRPGGSFGNRPGGSFGNRPGGSFGNRPGAGLGFNQGVGGVHRPGNRPFRNPGSFGQGGGFQSGGFGNSHHGSGHGVGQFSRTGANANKKN